MSKNLNFLLSIVSNFFEKGANFAMEVFQLQKEILKYCAIERFPSTRMKKYFIALKIFNLLVLFYCVFSAVLSASNTKDVREIAESMAAGFTAFVMLIKYACFCIQSENIFKIMDELEELNDECRFF